MEKSRFLEYTPDSISTQLGTLSTEAIACIQSWPCILMDEGRGLEKAEIMEIMQIERERANIKVTVRSLTPRLVIMNNALWRTRDTLDIAEFEFSRNHFAVKDRDLFALLSTEGVPIEDTTVSHFKPKPLPGPKRAQLIQAGKQIAEWSHTEIDEFLLEAGLTDLAAGRDIGSRRDRANAIIKYALANQGATTAENALFSLLLVNRSSFTTDIVTPDQFEKDFSGPPAPSSDSSPASATDTSNRSPNRVFVVHGQNEHARQRVTSFLKSVGLQGVVLHDQPNMGRHLLTKFIDEADLVTFAIVVMTDDDVGSMKESSSLAPRARQNVILELGYFLSHLGQPRVCALITPGLETPSDFDGIVYIKMDDGNNWQTELKRELLAAKMPLTE